ncbi:DUF4394 domain-containing protein [Plastoroseomonas arctica]|uniref:DUF4394 domain-containing protein n=1 Tax=Plastoroseomonas arctica TaxID=1509237 RepID=A0AAF1K5I3_9PROT|nr:DUF4394 domain-containing protein [Plastoroseomonas arctica]MBR0656364.1 DUF4394 domain-containing protein [Plastoroseomonas arctica]
MQAYVRAPLLAAAILASAGVAAEAQTLVGLTADNHLVRIDATTRRASAPVRVTGAEGRLLGIDVRPSNGMLYGLTDANQIVTIDAATGRATQVSRLSTPFTSGGRAVVDFNPVADRMRLMGASGMNFRINVDTGAVTTDGTLKYADGAPQAGTTPRIVAGAYTNSMAGATATALYTFDTLLRSYNLQAPPNDGIQAPRGTLPDLPAGVAFDILSDGAGANMGYLLAGNTLHSVALETGAPTALGAVTGLPQSEIIDIAAMR